MSRSSEDHDKEQQNKRPHGKVGRDRYNEALENPISGKLIFVKFLGSGGVVCGEGADQ